MSRPCHRVRRSSTRTFPATNVRCSNCVSKDRWEPPSSTATAPGHRNGLYPRNSRLRLRPGSRQGNRRLGGRQRQRRERRRAQFQQPRTPGAHHRDLPVGTQARLVDLPRNLRSVLPRHMAHRRCQAGVQPAGQRRRRRSLDDAAQQRRIRHLRTSRIRRPGDDHARRDLRQRTHRNARPFGRRRRGVRQFLGCLRALQRRSPAGHEPASASPASRRANRSGPST